MSATWDQRCWNTRPEDSGRRRRRSVGGDLRRGRQQPHGTTDIPPVNIITVMDDPKVTVIMRSYNEGWALRETLPALRAQDYANWELIVFDSGSSDGSVELLQAMQPRHF